MKTGPPRGRALGPRRLPCRYAIGFVLIVATLVMSAEQGHHSELDSFPDVLQRCIATVTTVGYGDVVPVMQVGRAFATC